MKAVITGATSLIGIALMDELLKEEETEILAFCSQHSKRIQCIPQDQRVRIIRCNLEEYKSLKTDLMGSYDYFFHCAWAGVSAKDRNNKRLQLENIGYTLDAVTLAHNLGCHTFVGMGSQAEYGSHDEKLNEDTPLTPTTAYGVAKYAAGRLSSQQAKEIHMKHIWVRILSIYGPADRQDTMIMSSAAALLKNNEADFTKAEQKWDYLYQSDAARALVLLARLGKDGETYLLGSGQSRPLYEYIDEMIEAIGNNSKANYGRKDYALGQSMYLGADISKLVNDTGFMPRVDFKTGILEVINSLKQKK